MFSAGWRNAVPRSTTPCSRCTNVWHGWRAGWAKACLLWLSVVHIPFFRPESARQRSVTNVLLSLEPLQHLLGDELMPGVVEVVAVIGEDASGLVFEVVLLPVRHEGLAQIVNRY